MLACGQTWTRHECLSSLLARVVEKVRCLYMLESKSELVESLECVQVCHFLRCVIRTLVVVISDQGGGGGGPEVRTKETFAVAYSADYAR
jgi:hypothetical protein